MGIQKLLYICTRFCKGVIRALSSAGSEHLPYKQGVTGSNPVGPTVLKDLYSSVGVFLCSNFKLNQRKEKGKKKDPSIAKVFLLNFYFFSLFL